MHDTILLTHIFFYFYSILPLIPLRLRPSNTPPSKIWYSNYSMHKKWKSGTNYQYIESVRYLYLPICVRISLFFSHFFFFGIWCFRSVCLLESLFWYKQEKTLRDVWNKYKRRKTVIKTFKNRSSISFIDLWYNFQKQPW